MVKENKNILLINKPLNWTSNDVVQKIKNIIRVKKVGHGGTLDPLATGLLVLGINNGTKEMYQYLGEKKTYIAEIVFGFSTDTYDMEGRKTLTSNIIPTLEEINNVLNNFKSNYKQVPPIYSAIKIRGKKAYELARKDQKINLQPRDVKLYNFEIISYEKNILKIEIEVSKGFYIRSLANDIGIKTNSASTLYSLKRIKIGELSLENAIGIEEVYDYWNK